jgi:hypothetical protein
MFSIAGGMPNGQDDDFIRYVIDRVIDQVRISPRQQFADTFNCLPPSDLGNSTRF